MRLEDSQVITVWKCDQCNDTCGVDVTFFQDSGTPVCGECDCDMTYDHVYLHRDYDGTKCPCCLSGNINADQPEAEGSDNFYRNCWCQDCNARWTEEAKVLRFELS